MKASTDINQETGLSFWNQRKYFTLAVLIISTVINFSRNEEQIVPMNPEENVVRNSKIVLEALDCGVDKALIGDRSYFIQEINAPQSLVFDIILKYDNSVKLRMLSDFILIEYHTKVVYSPEIQRVELSLDKNKTHNIHDIHSFWHVTESIDEEKDKHNWSRICHSVDMKVSHWMPNVVNRYFSRKAMTQAMTWIKIEAEQLWRDKQGYDLFGSNKRSRKSQEIDQSNQRKKTLKSLEISIDLKSIWDDYTSEIYVHMKPLVVGTSWLLLLLIGYLSAFSICLWLVQKFYASEVAGTDETTVPRRKTDF